MEKHQWAAIIMATLLVFISFIPVFVSGAFRDPGTFLLLKGWIYSTVGAAIAAILVVAAFWPRKS